MRKTLSSTVSSGVSSRFSSSSAQVTLLIPGLVWPHQALLDLSHDLPTPSLCALLGAGKLTALPGASAASLVASAVGYSAGYAAAPLRLKELGELGQPGPDADDQTWLCLDPVNLGFADGTLMVNDPAQLNISAEEAEQFAVSLAPTFSAFGELTVATPGAWHLRLKEPPPEALTRTRSLQDSIGRRADAGLDPGELPAEWRQALNEAQMILHAHPLNRTREAAGRPAVNSVWPWGAGRLSEAGANPHDLVLTNDVALRALARRGGAEVGTLPPEWLPGKAKRALIHLDLLDAATRDHDGLAWREALARLESHWFRPLREGLKRGDLNRLVLDLPGETTSFRLELGRTHLWRFWRRARPLTCLAAP